MALQRRRRCATVVAASAAAAAAAAAPSASEGGGLKNVLLIIVDDLRPQLGAYGVEFMHTPNMDRLAEEGALFTRAYVQQAICGPTRNSFMSGRYPEKTLTWNFIDHFRAVGDSWTALPEFFRDRGYFTTGAGKVYHPDKPPQDDNKRSWSEPWVGSHGPMAQCQCGGQATCEGLSPLPACGDDAIVETVIGQLQRAENGTLGNGTQPFFIAAGLHKPHLPFHARAEDSALYPDPAPPVPLTAPEGMPFVAWHSCLSHAPGVNYSDWTESSDIPNAMTLERPMPAAVAARLRRGYYASVTYTDRNVGLILAAAQPMLQRTVVALMGDHGWSLGEQNEWCKMTNFENGVRVPLIVRAPWAQARAGMRIAQLAEAVDLYRTLADLSGVGAAGVEGGVDGASLAPLLAGGGDAAAAGWRVAARSVFPRCYTALENASSPCGHFDPCPIADARCCANIPREKFDFMGYSIRTDRWRYTEWRAWDGAALRAVWNGAPHATELYDHATPPEGGAFASEAANVASDPALAATVRQLGAQLRGIFDEP